MKDNLELTIKFSGKSNLYTFTEELLIDYMFDNIDKYVHLIQTGQVKSFRVDNFFMFMAEDIDQIVVKDPIDGHNEIYENYILPDNNYHIEHIFKFFDLLMSRHTH